MKKLLVLFIVFNSFFGFSQDYERVDATIELYPKTFKNAEEFSKFLSRDFHTEEEKVRAVYTWLIQNVSYNPDEYKNFNYSFKNYRERNKKEEKSRAKIIERTLQSGQAVCEGYAFAFEKMCQLQGIENYLIRGDTKTQISDIGRSFKKNHMWNAARIDGAWFLFDATWGAGKFNGKFIKEPSYFYYKTSPEQLVKSHFPDMKDDTFLKNPIMFSQFTYGPLIISKNLLPEHILSPKEGTLFSHSSMNTFYFEIKTAAPNEIYYAYNNEKELVLFEEVEGVLHFSVPIQIGPTSLLIYFDDEPVLGYKIE